MVVILLLLPVVAMAQEWAPIGAIWHYSFYTYNPNLISYIKFESIGDTTLYSQQAKIIAYFSPTNEFGDYNPVFDTLYMYSDSNRVYFFEEDSVKYYSLYDFNLNQNEMWFIDYWTSYPVIVDSTSTITINSNNLKVQHVSTPSWNGTEFEGKIIERIGSVRYMMPTGDGSMEGPLRCYEDSILGLYKTGVTLQCDQIITSTPSYSAKKISVKLHPNPTTGKFQIQSPKTQDPGMEVQVYDLLGREVTGVRRKVSAGAIDVDLSAYPSGIYLVKIGEHTQKLILSK